jgi:Protein of unknown function (DUF2934)
MADRDERIRELAYLLWLEEGYPEGQSERHWLKAEILIESESSRPKAESPAESELEPEEPRKRAARADDNRDQKKRRGGSDSIDKQA